MPTRGTFPIRGKVPTRQNARSDGRFIERTLRINFIERIKVPIFIDAVLSMQTMHEPRPNLAEKDIPSILKVDFSSRADPLIFTSIAPELFK